LASVAKAAYMPRACRRNNISILELSGMARPITSIADLRAIAKRRVPRMFYDYCDSGAWTESTYRENESDFVPIKLRQRVAVDMRNRTLETTMAGEKVSMPVAIAPTGLTGMQHADGEIHGARAAEKAGVPFTLSTMSICSIEDIAEPRGKPFWFQLYVMKDRDFIARLIQRAKAAGVLGAGADARPADPRPAPQGHPQRPVDAAAPTIANHHQPGDQAALVPQHAATTGRTFGNIVGHAKGVGDMRSLSSWTAEQFDPALSWDDVKWIKDQWGGKLILKGILDPEDAEKAAAERRRRADRLQPWRPPARRRALLDRGAAGDRRCRSATASRCCSMAASAPART
jgi:L-lactate dehydrogenase (cytochrome)